MLGSGFSASSMKYGASGFEHDPHGIIGLVVEPAVKFVRALKDLTPALSARRPPVR